MDALDILAIGLAAKGGGGGGTSDYSDLSNKPQINDVTLSGNKSLEDLGIPNYVAGDNVSITEDSEGNSVISAVDTTYTAGTNIDITGGVISATDTTYTAGTGIDITSDVISIDNTVALKSDIPAAELPTITSSDAGKILKVNSNHDGVEWGSESTELPTITGNANKILKVNSGATAVEWANEATELPSISSGDAGKVLTVNSGETGVEWAAGGGGSSYTFTDGLAESSGTVSWDLYDRVRKGNNGIKIGRPSNNNWESINADGTGSISGGKSYRSSYHQYPDIRASGQGSISYGNTSGNNKADAKSISADGNGSVAIGHVNKGRLLASGLGSRAEGAINNSSSYPSSEDNAYGIVATGIGSVAEGYTDILGSYNSAPLKAAGTASHASGYCVRALSDYQHAIGKFNVDDTSSTYAFIIGNGTADNARSNALTVDWNGNIECNNIPAPPSSDGNYVLQCSVSSGVPTYSWVAQS